MQLRQSLLSQLDGAIALLQQRPDTLEPFTAWLEAAAVHFLPGVAAAVASSKPQEQQQGEHRAGQAGTWHLSLEMLFVIAGPFAGWLGRAAVLLQCPLH